MSETIKNAVAIVTHPGPAHRDDFLSCCFLLAINPKLSITRYDPLVEGGPEHVEHSLGDPKVIVVDVGGRHEPELLNFDHHQLPRDAAPVCSLTYVLQHLGVYEASLELFQWLRFTEIADSKGPAGVSKHLGTSWEKIGETLSPIETTVLRWFSDQQVVVVGSELHTLMFRIGDEKLAYLEKVKARLERITQYGRLSVINDVVVLDLEAVAAGDDDPTLGVELWCKKHHPEIGVVVSHDDRGPGLSLFRRDDHPRVDFSRIKHDPRVGFVHVSGFIAKTTGEVCGNSTAIRELLEASITPYSAIRDGIETGIAGIDRAIANYKPGDPVVVVDSVLGDPAKFRSSENFMRQSEQAARMHQHAMLATVHACKVLGLKHTVIGDEISIEGVTDMEAFAKAKAAYKPPVEVSQPVMDSLLTGEPLPLQAALDLTGDRHAFENRPPLYDGE